MNRSPREEKNSTSQKPHTAKPRPAKPRPAKPRAAKPLPERSQETKPLPRKPTAAQQAATPPPEPEQEVAVGYDFAGLIYGMPSWLMSMVVHMLLLVALALVFVPVPPNSSPPSMELAEVEEPEEEIDKRQIELKKPLAPELAQEDTRDDSPPPPEPPPPGPPEVALETGITEPALFDSPVFDLPPSAVAPLAENRPGGGDDPYGRRAQAGLGDAGDRSPSDATEDAIDRALEWLAAHQMQDGGWSFDHGSGACQGRCGQPGSHTAARNGATGLALLAFLGRGNTHQEGDYQDEVRAGLEFLVARMQRGPVADTGSFYEVGGTMYSHGIATIALAEAYGMSKDSQLRYPAQCAVNFVVYAQDPIGGGWRYEVHQAGDTSIVGWQLMALKSAQMAGLQVNAAAYEGAIHFLDSVQTDSGASYGYTGPGQGRATTAIGLLSRMYLGWRRDHGALERGGAWLATKGPSQSNLYYNYYASQVLLHLDDPDDEADRRFDDWDDELRPWLVSTQEMEGHMRGSWFINGDHGSGTGGRLYSTAMATLMLEVYYRTSLIYQQQTIEQDFPL